MTTLQPAFAEAQPAVERATAEATRLRDAGQTDRALSTARGAATSATDPADAAVARYTLATIFDEAERRSEALDAYRRFLELDVVSDNMRAAATARVQVLERASFAPPLPTANRPRVEAGRVVIGSVGGIHVGDNAHIGDENNTTINLNVGAGRRTPPAPTGPATIETLRVVLLVVGIVSIAVGGATGALVLGRDDQLAEMCDASGTCPARAAGLISERTNLAIAADTLFVAGGALTLGGGILWIID